MNLSINSTIIELSAHASNSALKVLHREEPGARFWSKLMLKLQFRCLEIHRRFLPWDWSKTGIWLAQKTHDFAKQRWFYFLKTQQPPWEHKWWCSPMMMFYKMLEFFFDLYSVSRHISKHYSKHVKSPYFVRPIFLTFLPDKFSLSKGSLTYNLRLTL